MFKTMGQKFEIPNIHRVAILVCHALKRAKTKSEESDIQGVIMECHANDPNYTCGQLLERINTKEQLRSSLAEARMFMWDQQAVATVTTATPPPSGRRYCYRFQRGDCRFNPCKFVHQRDPEKPKVDKGPVTCDRCGMLGHTKEECKRVQCGFCKKFGHSEEACYKKNGRAPKKVANYVCAGQDKPDEGQPAHLHLMNGETRCSRQVRGARRSEEGCVRTKSKFYRSWASDSKGLFDKYPEEEVGLGNLGFWC